MVWRLQPVVLVCALVLGVFFHVEVISLFFLFALKRCNSLCTFVRDIYFRSRMISFKLSQRTMEQPGFGFFISRYNLKVFFSSYCLNGTRMLNNL